LGEAAPEGLTTVPHAELVSRKGVYVMFLPSPKMWASPLCKIILCHSMFLRQLSTFWGEDCRVVHSSGFAKRYVPIIFLNLIERI
jgi:hypothetical protein